MMKKNKQDFHQLSVRFPPEMGAFLQDRARNHGRSVSQEIVQLVKAQLEQEQKKDTIATGAQER